MYILSPRGRSVSSKSTETSRVSTKSSLGCNVQVHWLTPTLTACKKRPFSSATHAANIHAAEVLSNNSITTQSARSGTGSCEVDRRSGIRTRHAASANISERSLGFPLQRSFLACGPGPTTRLTPQTNAGFAFQQASPPRVARQRWSALTRAWKERIMM